MDIEKAKRAQLKQLQPKTYRIYGIFNFKTEALVFVDLDLEKVAFEFDLEGYADTEFGIISFKVVVT